MRPKVADDINRIIRVAYWVTAWATSAGHMKESNHARYFLTLRSDVCGCSARGWTRFLRASCRTGHIKRRGQPMQLVPVRRCARDHDANLRWAAICGAAALCRKNGSIFLCGDACAPWEGAGVPPILQSSPDYLLKAYSADDRIIYGTGQITAAKKIVAVASGLLERGNAAYVDVRSARNNCFQTRIRRAT